ncbi:Kelch-like member 28 [Elasticomyces elasticus]|uniref:Kelch-like member 28 n=1 Tax=Elasticomyces elasticus TaxID=574655 RepID=A0AAN7VX27_9PEZI|nr:Kelch-like member 28 [Elasticomyces elasticus]
MDAEATKIPADSFFNSPELSDITLRCGDNKIHAHKVILAQGSPYFRQLFAQKDEDKQDEVITLDGEPEALKGMLAWLYGLEYCGQDHYEYVETIDLARYPAETKTIDIWCSTAVGSKAYVLYLLALADAGTRYNVSRLVELAMERMPYALVRAHAHRDEALVRQIYAAEAPPEVKRLFAKRFVSILKDFHCKWTGKRDRESDALLLEIPQLALDAMHELL